MKRILLTLLLIPLAIFGQTRDPVMVDTNGVVKFPGNFFGLNAASNALALGSYFQAANANLQRLADISAATGSILYRDASGWTNRAAGSNGQVLTLVGGVPDWAGSSGGISDAPSDGTRYVRLNAGWSALDTDLQRIADIAAVTGALLYRDASGWTNLSAGSVGQVLTMGGGSIPSWAAASGGIGDAPSDGTRYVRLNAGWTALDSDLQRLADISASTGAVLYRDATGWTNRAAGSNGQVLTLVGGVPDWASGSGSISVNGSVASSPNIVDNWWAQWANASGTITATPKSPVTISFAATMNPNMTNGVTHRITMTGDATLGAVSGAVDNQPIRVEVRQDSTGTRILTVDPAGWLVPNELPVVNVLTNANALTVIGGRYHTTTGKVLVESVLTYQ